MWSKICAGVIGVCLVLGGGALCYHWGKRVARAEETERAHQALEVANKKYRDLEAEHAVRVETLQAKYAAATEKERHEDIKIATDLGTGRKRMRLRTTRCTDSPQASSSASRTDAAPVAELAPETAAALYAIAADGDEAIRQLTALQSWAKSAVTLCGGPR